MDYTIAVEAKVYKDKYWGRKCNDPKQPITVALFVVKKVKKYIYYWLIAVGYISLNTTAFSTVLMNTPVSFCNCYNCM